MSTTKAPKSTATKTAARKRAPAKKQTPVQTTTTKKRTPTPKPQVHFAIGLPVRVRPKAVPVGWSVENGMGRFCDGRNWSRDDYNRTFQIQSVGDDGSFEVMGWFWSPFDLEIPYS